MSTKNTQHGRREAPKGPSVWSRYKVWLAGLNRGQRIRFRLLQAAAVLGVIVIAVILWLRAWIQLPEVPDLPAANPDSSQAGDDIFDGAELPEVARSGRKPGYYTFLVAGQDVVSGGTDTILLFTFDTQNKTLNAVSILRDTMINTSASSKRINTVYARNRGSSSLPEGERVENGMTALKQEVSKLTGIYPDFYVLIQWEAVGELVDALGGVYFDVPFDMNYDDPAQDLHIHQEAGYRKLYGEDAMEVVRWRKNNTGSSGGDVARTEVQQEFLAAVLDTCLQPSTLLKLPSLAQVFLDNVTTDLSVGNLLAFAQLAVGMDTENDVAFSTMPYTGVYYNGASMVVANQSAMLELLNDGLNPYQDEIRASDLQLMYRNSDGSFGVTNGTLADERMGRPAVVAEPDPEPEEGETDPGGTDQPEEQNPDEGGSQGDSSSELGSGGTQEESTGQEGETPQDGTEDQGSGESQGGEADSPSESGTAPEGGSGSEAPGQGGQTQETPGESVVTDPGSLLPDPDDVLPDPGESVIQDSQTTQGETEQNPVVVLPARPEPAGQAA